MTHKEVPIFFPNNHTDPPPRYVLDFHQSHLVIADHDVSSNSNPSNRGAVVAAEAIAEAASVSEIKLRGKNYVVTTSALVNQPDIVSVALFHRGGNANLDAPQTVELYTGDLQVVAVRSFADDSTVIGAAPLSPAKFWLVLVGIYGTIVSVSLDENLVPDAVNPLKVLFAQDFVPASLQSSLVGTHLRPTMVDFLSSDKHQMVMALSPSLMTIDWMDSGKCEVWTESQCREDMKSRSRMLDFSNFAFGRIDDGVVDMAPTAAVCVSSNKVKDSGSIDVVFTIHSDGRLRKWLVDPEKSFRPFDVATAEADDLPSPSSWSDARNSVAMCARLYGVNFALGVYIKTDMVPGGQSACNLWAFNGQAKGSFAESLELKIPKDVENVIGVAFNPADSRCSLCAIFECSERGRGETKPTTAIRLASYPPDHVVIVGSQPEFIATDNYDQIAKTERERILALSYGSTVLSEIASDESTPTVEEALNAVDSLFMKFLFKPLFPRGSGTVLPPSDDSIRRALSTLVSNSRQEYGISIELETIKTLHEWRKRDKVQSRALLPRNDAGKKKSTDLQSEQDSIYASYIETAYDENPTYMRDNDGTAVDYGNESELISEVEAHQKRWKQLLCQIWEEEQILRFPVHVAWLHDFNLPVMVRGGLTSVLAPNHAPPKANSLITFLDDASHEMISLVEADPSQSRALHKIEERIARVVSRFLMDPFPKSSIEEDLTFLGRWAFYKSSNAKKLRSILTEMPFTDIIDWMGRIPEGIDDADMDCSIDDNKMAHLISNIHLRMTTCGCIVRAVDAIRRERLGKCLLLYALETEDLLDKVAFRSYMNAISVLWTSSQRVTMPESDVPRANENTFLPSNAPAWSFRTSPSGIVRPKSVSTTVLDALLVGTAKDSNRANDQSLPWGVDGIVRGFTTTAFAENRNRMNCLMPELSAIPDRNLMNENEYYSLASRLLAPFVDMYTPNDPPEAVIARMKEMSDCLLHASTNNDVFSVGQKTRMLQMASALLNPNGVFARDDLNPLMIEEGLKYMSQFSPGDGPDMERLRSLLWGLLPGVTSSEIDNVIDLDCTKDLFSRLDGEVLPNIQPCLQAVAEGFLVLSRIFFRVNMFENRISYGSEEGGFVGGDADVRNLLEVISDGISEMEVMFPESFNLRSHEYRSLWMKKFNVARRSARWNEAYSVCFEKSIHKKCLLNLSSLAKDMVDNGGLLELIRFCRPFRAAESGEMIDLYPIACDVLLEHGAKQDVYMARASLSGSRSITDYQGALYALHASQLQWQRAAHILNMRFEGAEECLRTNQYSFCSNLMAAIIVGDLVLSSCGAANAILLVKDPVARFVTNSETTWRSSHIPNNSGSRRGTLGDGNFIGPSLLETVAIRTIGLRTSYFDSSIGQHVSIKAFCSDFEDFEETEHVVNLLFGHGYYYKGLLLAKKYAEYVKEMYRKTSQYGVDVFSGFVIGLVKNFLLPKSLNASTTETRPMSDTRPTLNQLQIANDSFGKVTKAPCVVDTIRSIPPSTLPETAIQVAVWALIRKVTNEFSTSKTPVALEVAKCILKLDDDARIPAWLERLLLGADVDFSNSGAFAPRALPGCQQYLGNPSGLLSLYIQEGLFCEACDLVASVLDQHCSRVRRAGEETTRLPEKGNIDYVPYMTIDILYNLVQTSLNGNKYDEQGNTDMLKALKSMEDALKRYSRFLSSDETGLQSARILHQGY